MGVNFGFLSWQSHRIGDDSAGSIRLGIRCGLQSGACAHSS